MMVVGISFCWRVEGHWCNDVVVNSIVEERLELEKVSLWRVGWAGGCLMLAADQQEPVTMLMLALSMSTGVALLNAAGHQC